MQKRFQKTSPTSQANRILYFYLAAFAALTILIHLSYADVDISNCAVVLCHSNTTIKGLMGYSFYHTSFTHIASNLTIIALATVILEKDFRPIEYIGTLSASSIVGGAVFVFTYTAELDGLHGASAIAAAFAVAAIITLVSKKWPIPKKKIGVSTALAMILLICTVPKNTQTCHTCHAAGGFVGALAMICLRKRDYNPI